MKRGKRRWQVGIRRLVSLILTVMLVLGSLTLFPGGKVRAAGINLIKNPNFEKGTESWMDTGAQIKCETQKDPIFDDVKTYATICGRTQSYQGFSQDVSDVVIPGEEYEVSYYVKLSEDYKELAASQRQVFFGPYIVEDGITKYLSQAYSGEIGGALIKQIPAEKWVKLSGTFRVSDGAEQVVVRFQEESATLGDYSITGVSMKLMAKEMSVVSDEKLPRLRDAITAELGEDTIVGMVTHPVNNKKEWAILTTHANAITAGNEFKPDAHFGYSNTQCPGTETVTLNGKKLLVPKIDYSRGEQVLNAVLKYNEANPETPIKVRGHVLVWHAQTPEWFFHEDYDATKDYVTKEVLDQRLEWYIKSLFEHYMGKNSKYKDLFYGWDVVNEACSDSTSMVYRDDKGGNDKLTDPTHSSKSSWWHIYQSNEYIINAFKYANKYAPANVELYYNDYNDSWPVKVPNICALLKAIKEQEGAPGVGTRIDAFGMQAHYAMDSFSIQNFEAAARQYLDIVGKIQLTELDMAASSNYDGTAATKDQEYQDQALVYQSIYECLKKLDAIDGYEVGGITFWGVTDPTSWLQNKSDLGGGADGLRSQCPLLFDGNYEPKPAFWAFVDPSKIPILAKNVEVRRSYDARYTGAVSYPFRSGETMATAYPIWTLEGFRLRVEVKDKTLNGKDDFVTVYLTEDTKDRDGMTPKIYTAARSESIIMAGGYAADFNIPLEEVYFGKQFLFDVKVNDGSGTVFALGDAKMQQEESSKNYAVATLKPALMNAFQGSPKVDGEPDEVWDTAETFWLNINTGAAQCAAKVKVLWDEKKLYIYAQVQDGDISVKGREAYEQDSLEVYIDEDHARSNPYDKDDKRYRINAENKVSCLGTNASEKRVESKVRGVAGGYVIEASFEWTDKKPKIDDVIGFDLRVNDADADGTRIGTLSFCDVTQDAGTDAACFGTVRLSGPGTPIAECENPDLDVSGARSFSAAAEKPGANADNETQEGKDEKETSAVSAEKEVPDNPPKEVPWPSILLVVAVSFAGVISHTIANSRKKRKQDEKQKNTDSEKKS